MIKYGLALVLLVFIGVKMLLLDLYKIPIAPGVAALIIISSVIASLLVSRAARAATPRDHNWNR